MPLQIMKIDVACTGLWQLRCTGMGGSAAETRNINGPQSENLRERDARHWSKEERFPFLALYHACPGLCHFAALTLVCASPASDGPRKNGIQTKQRAGIKLEGSRVSLSLVVNHSALFSAGSRAYSFVAPPGSASAQ
jgi:hypothetical protein